MSLNRREFTIASLGSLAALGAAGTGAKTPPVNRRIVLASRPTGVPGLDNFRLEELPVPEPAEGEVLLRTRYLSLDPYMRGRMSDAASYAEPVDVGEVMVGGTVSEVVASRNPKFAVGELVSAFAGWQDYALSNGTGLMKIDPRIPRPSYALGVLGMPGLTAYVGLLDIGEPKAGETVVLAAATGAVGSVVGQIAKLKGCRVVGIAGSKEKCQYAVEVLGYDACISHYDRDMAQQLAAACPAGIDVYFENVGGEVWDAVMPLLNNFARVPICGLISQYNKTELPAGPDRISLLQGLILQRSLKIQGFIISNYQGRIPDFIGDMSGWLAQGKIKYREDIVEGLENAPRAFLGLFSGDNFGKLVVRVS